MRVVIALGGNAIARRGEGLAPEAQRTSVAEAVAAFADIVRGHDVVITHGNGPQVGLLAMQALPPSDATPPYPLDVLGAETEGQIGYLLESELAGVFPNNEIAALLTQVEVDPKDPAFEAPTKPIGRALPREQAAELARRLGWQFAFEDGTARRVVPSPEPRAIRELRTISLLLEAGVIVVCAGGGGIPVVPDASGAPVGVEAVIDKDLTAALLARELGADWLLLLTDVPAIYRDWPGREAPIDRIAARELRALDLAAGSMGPKAEAACRFALAGGKAAIGRLDEARQVLEGRAGTRVEG